MRSMIRKFTTVWAVCTLLFFLVLMAVLLVQLNDARTVAIARSEAHFSELHRALTAQRTAAPTTIQRLLSESTTADSALRAIALYSFDAGLEYLWVRNRSYLGNDEPPQPATPVTPEFSYDRVTEIVLTDSLRTAGGQTLVAEAVYRTLDGPVWYRLLRRALIAVLLFALLSVLLTIGVLLAERTPQSATEGPTRSAPQRATPPAATAPQPSATLFSPRSGVSYESHLERRLTLELERAASNDQDLSFALCRFPGIAPGTESYQRCCQAIIEQFLFEDLIFEKGSDGFAVVLPNTDLGRTIKQFEAFYQQLKSAALPGRPLFGLTARSGRLIEADRLIREAQHALGKAQREARPIIAFKADPQRYRDFVAGQSP